MKEKFDVKEYLERKKLEENIDWEYLWHEADPKEHNQFLKDMEEFSTLNNSK